MKKPLFFLASVSLLALALPIFGQDATPEATSETESGTNHVTFNNFAFSYDPSLGSAVTINVEAGDAPDVQQPGGPVPPNTLYAIYNGDNSGSTTWPSPDFAPNTIRVYRSSGLASYSYQEAQFNQLQSLIMERPDLSTYTVVPDDVSQQSQSLPMLNSVPASQTIRAQPQFIDASGFWGIAYITAYRQDVSPFLSNSFVYTYQGITEDGWLAVSAWFDVTTTLFPESTPSDFDYNSFSADYATYLQQSVETLNNASPDDFSPSLTTLDALIQSISYLGSG